jgi:hypothetical protein
MEKVRKNYKDNHNQLYFKHCVFIDRYLVFFFSRKKKVLIVICSGRLACDISGSMYVRFH